jgi:hypothetical protein
MQLALAALAACVADAARLVIYVDSKGIEWGNQPPIPIVNTAPTDYNVAHCGFYLPSISNAADFAFSVPS